MSESFVAAPRARPAQEARRLEFQDDLSDVIGNVSVVVTKDRRRIAFAPPVATKPLPVSFDSVAVVGLTNLGNVVHAAQRLFRRLLKGQEGTPLELVTDRLKSYGAARRSIMPSVERNAVRYANNRAEVSHQPTRQRERQMRGFKLPGHALRFLSVQGVAQNCSRLGRHLFHRSTTQCRVTLSPREVWARSR